MKQERVLFAGVENAYNINNSKQYKMQRIEI